MKPLLIFMLAATQLFSFGQDNFALTKRIFKASIARTTANTYTGYIAGLKDSAIYLTDNAAAIRYNSIVENDLTKIKYGNIEQVIIKRKGSVGRGILTGTLIGIGTGVIAGLILGSDPACDNTQTDFSGLGYALCEAFSMTAGEKALLLGGTGAVGGAILGGIIGGVARKRYIIGGKKEKFDQMKLSVLERIYGKGQN